MGYPCNLLRVAVLFCFAMISACATQVTEKPAESYRASKPLGEFSKVVLVEAELAPQVAGKGSNGRAIRKINQVLWEGISEKLENVLQVSAEDHKAMNISDSETNGVLVIKPYVKQIKYIGGAVRFWVGAMAGSSVVVMDASFIDAASGNQVGVYGTYRKAAAYADGFGLASNRMLEDAANDIVRYVIVNR